MRPQRDLQAQFYGLQRQHHAGLPWTGLDILEGQVLDVSYQKLPNIGCLVRPNSRRYRVNPPDRRPPYEPFSAAKISPWEEFHLIRYAIFDRVRGSLHPTGGICMLSWAPVQCTTALCARPVHSTDRGTLPSHRGSAITVSSLLPW